MVKLFSKIMPEVSQSVGTLTFRKLSGKAGQTLQTKPVPHNPNSPAQQARRRAFSRLCYLWSADKIKDKQCYIDIAHSLDLDKTNFYLRSLLDIITYAPAICFRFSQQAGELIDLSNKAQNTITAQQYTTVELETGKRVCQGNGTSDHIYIGTTEEINETAISNRTYFVAFCPLSIPSEYAIVWEEGGSANGANIFYDQNAAYASIYNSQPNTATYWKVKIADLKLNEFIVAAIRLSDEDDTIVAYTTTEQEETAWTPPLLSHPDPNGVLAINSGTTIDTTGYNNSSGYYFYANAQLAHFSINNVALSDQKIYKILKDIERLVGKR